METIQEPRPGSQTLAGLLNAHDAFPAGLSRNFGDAFLLAHNVLYRRVREGAIARGFQFSHERDDAYHALSVAQLDRILDSKVIPYMDNVTVLRDVVARAPGTKMRAIALGYKRNSVFHEAAHAVAHLSWRTETDLPADRQLAFRALLEEAFANACETFGVSLVQDPQHEIFYRMNSFVWIEEGREVLTLARAQLGERHSFKALTLAFLHANFLRTEVDRTALIRVCGPSDQDDLLLRLCSLAFRLNPQFLSRTARLHMDLHGIATPLPELFAFDFSAVEGLPMLLDRMADAVCT